MKLLDTSVLVEIDRGNCERAVEKLDSEGRHAVSQASVTEMFLGLEYQYDRGSEEYQRARNQLEKFFSRFEVVPVNQPVSVKAAEIIAELREKGRPVDDLHDTYIAASGVCRDLEVLTRNTDHFQAINGLEVRSWDDYR